jgi:ADP-ribose pyrophosphatase
MATSSLDWELIGTRPGSCGWVNVTTATFRMPDGAEADWDLVEGPDIVAMVATTGDGDVILVRQFRHGPAQVLSELPGGIVDLGETPLEAAERELLEETGYAGTATIVGSVWRSGAETRRQWVALVTGCRRVAEPEPGPVEFIEVELMGTARFRDHVRSGQLTDTGAAYRALDQLGLL